jgi:hypothetical protein
MKKEMENPGAREKPDTFSGSLDNASTACIMSGSSSKALLDGAAGGTGATPCMPRPLHALRTPPARPHARPPARPLHAPCTPSARPCRRASKGASFQQAGGGVFEESSGKEMPDTGQKMEAAEVRQQYEALDTGGMTWGKGLDKGKEMVGASSDPALCARVDKLVSEQHNLVSEVAYLRSGIAMIEQLLRQGLPLPGAAAPQGRAALQPRRLSAAGGCEQSTRQLLAAAAGTSAAGGIQPATLPAVGAGGRPLNNLEA